MCIALQLLKFNHNAVHPIETEGDDSEVQTNGTGDDAGTYEGIFS